MEHTPWNHLPLLVRSGSKELVECILQALWRTHKTRLYPTEREIIRNMRRFPAAPILTLSSSKDVTLKLFPDEVKAEYKRLLTFLLQKFQKRWQEEVLKERVGVNGS